MPENRNKTPEPQLLEILFITSYPPRECGIATYSQDLIKALNHKFDQSFKLSICPLESDNEQHMYKEPIKYMLNTDQVEAFTTLAQQINENIAIQLVLIQHEFGFFEKKQAEFVAFLTALTKPIVIVFHTVLPEPGEALQKMVQQISAASASIIVMTHASADILVHTYGVPEEKIEVIPHGTHLVPHLDKKLLKKKYKLSGKKILSTFGLLSSGKSIETTIQALPQIVAQNPDVLFLIIGKTHPSVLKQEGEKYRHSLETLVEKLHMQPYVQFINHFLPLPDLLEYLQLTDIYLFTSKDPNQAVSGTFSYAISSGCAIVSTPIPHAREVLRDEAGIIIDFENHTQLSEAVIRLLNDDVLRKNISSQGLHKIAPSAWENAAIAHARLFENISNNQIILHYTLPALNLRHIKKLTTDFGMIQFSKINKPDIDSGYTLDDNARAMIAMCQHYASTKDKGDLKYIRLYLDFIQFCFQPTGTWLNYVDEQKEFTDQNNTVNLEDSNGRALWALGYLVSMRGILPEELTTEADVIIEKALPMIEQIHSTRAMSFIIKGLYYRNTTNKNPATLTLIRQLADRLVQMYRHESEKGWNWYESYLTYANSILPEALLCAWLATHELLYKQIAVSSFDFLLSKIFRDDTINIVSNRAWMQKGDEIDPTLAGGEQPIDIAYTIMTLSKFYEVFQEEEYGHKMEISFNWFLGKNHLNQIIYNPCTGGCYDGLETNNVNLNQGAESTVSYLMARLTMDHSPVHTLEWAPKEEHEWV